MPSSMLNKKHNAIAYHCVREAIARNIVRFHHIRSHTNLADILTKPLGWLTFDAFIRTSMFRISRSMEELKAIWFFGLSFNEFVLDLRRTCAAGIINITQILKFILASMCDISHLHGAQASVERRICTRKIFRTQIFMKTKESQITSSWNLSWCPIWLRA